MTTSLRPEQEFIHRYLLIQLARKERDAGFHDGAKRLIEAEKLYDFVDQAPEFRPYQWVHQDAPDFIGRDDAGRLTAFEVTELVEPQARKSNRLIEEVAEHLEESIRETLGRENPESRWMITYPLDIPTPQSVGRTRLERSRNHEAVGRAVVQAILSGSPPRCLETDLLPVLIEQLPAGEEGQSVVVLPNRCIGTPFLDPVETLEVTRNRIRGKDCRPFSHLPPGTPLALLIFSDEFAIDPAQFQEVARQLAGTRTETVDRVFLLAGMHGGWTGSRAFEVEISKT